MKWQTILLTCVLVLAIFTAIPMISEKQAVQDVDDQIGSTRATFIVGQGQTYTKIQDAVDAASAGDTVRVYAGVYSENVVLDKKINLVGNNSFTTYIQSWGFQHVVWVKANWCNVSGFSLRADTSDSNGVRIDNTYSNISVSNCNFTNLGTGVSGAYSKDIIIENCQFFSNLGQGIRFWHDTARINISYCRFEQNAYYGIDLYDVHDSRIYKCDFVSDNISAMKMVQSDNNEISFNDFILNDYDSLVISFCDYNLVYFNDFSYTVICSILLYGSPYNCIDRNER